MDWIIWGVHSPWQAFWSLWSSLVIQHHRETRRTKVITCNDCPETWWLLLWETGAKRTNQSQKSSRLLASFDPVTECTVLSLLVLIVIKNAPISTCDTRCVTGQKPSVNSYFMIDDAKTSGEDGRDDCSLSGLFDELSLQLGPVNGLCAPFVLLLSWLAP